MESVMKKRCLLKTIAVVLGIMTAAVFGAGVSGITAGPAFAESVSGAGDREAVFSFESDKEREAFAKSAGDFDEAFDLRAYGTVTPVKQQAPFGSCWGFSAIAASESSLIADGIADENVDLSEKQLVYFAVSYLDDPDDPQNGEGVHYKNPTGAATQKYDMGGGPVMASSLLAAGIGPVQESVDDILVYKGRKGEKVSRKIVTSHDEDGNPVYENVPLWYSEKDDWSIPEDYRYCHSYRLKESYELPNPTPRYLDKNYNGVRDEGEEWDNTGVLAIKDQLQNHHRAVSVSYSAETFLPGDDTSDKRFMSSNWAHYTWDRYSSADHAVTIVGWDDNYPRENFGKSPDDIDHQPPADMFLDGCHEGATDGGNGAWLIKNSWGSDLNDPDAMTNGYRHFGLFEGQDCVPYDPDAAATSDKSTGYFWVSYYDNTLTMAEAYAYDKTDGENSHIEQMDTLPMIDLAMPGCEGCRMANVFTAGSTAKLTDITVLTTTPGTEVSYKVFLLPDKFSSPEDGLLIEEGDESYKYGGYHLIALNDPTVLAKGQKYSVVVTETAPGRGDYVCCATGRDLEDMSIVPVTNPKESFYYSEGTWKDLSEAETQQELLYDTEVRADNFPIKAHLEAVTYKDKDGNDAVFDAYVTVSNWEEGAPGAYELQTRESKKVAAEFHGITHDLPAGWNPDFEWSSSDPEVTSVAVKENNNCDATITGVSEGSAYIMVDTGGWGVRLVSVEVHKPQVLMLFRESDKTKYTFTGKPIRPAVSWVMADDKIPGESGYELVEGVDFKVVYEKNVNAGTASMYAVGIGDFGGKTDTETFTIVKAKNTLKAKGKTAKLKAGTLTGKKLTKKTLTIQSAKACTIANPIGKVTYSKVKLNKKEFSKKFIVNKKTGKITVKKGVKEGTYRMTVKVKAAGDRNHKALKKKITITIKITE